MPVRSSGQSPSAKVGHDRAMPVWIDTHCHLDAPELAPDVDAVRARATQAGVARCVIPAVDVRTFDAARLLARRFGDGYALGIHPLYVERAADDALNQLDAALTAHADDPHLVGVGEIGLDYFVPELATGPPRERQDHFYREQLRLARRHGLHIELINRRRAEQRSGLRARVHLSPAPTHFQLRNAT